MDFKKKQKITSDLYEEFKAKRGDKPKDEYFDYEYACFLQNKIVELKSCEGNPSNLKKGKCNKHIVNCFKTDGEQLIKTLGFELDHQYNHDHFHTNRYRKGLLMVEFTYNGFRLETVDLTIDETFCKPITYAELKAITPVLGEIPA